MKVRFQYGDRVLSLPGRVLERLSEAGQAELKLLLALAGSDGEADPDVLSGQTGLGSEDVMRGLDFWRGAGVIAADGGTPGNVAVTEHRSEGVRVSVVHSGDAPAYTGKEIERLFEQNDGLRKMIDECQRLLGKLLSVGEINKLIGLIDSYRFPEEFVLLLVKRCVESGKGSVPYIVRSAISLYNSGIVTVEALEDKIREDDEYSAMELTLRRLMGWDKRALTEREKRFVKNWTEWQIPDDMLRLVYDITVDATKGPSMPYMNKVLTGWREAGYKTADDARAAMEQYKQKKAAAATGKSSFNRDEFFEAAIRNSLEKHGKSDS